MAGDKEQLLAMGFSEAKVKKALRVTKNSGLQPAMDWLLEHSEDPDPADDEAADEAEAEEDSQIAKIESQPGVEARSLVCDDCGKKFRTHASAEFHAGKSGHENFSESTEEIKPLTEEEKKAKLEEMRAAMAVKRAAQSKEDVEDQKRNEQIRRKAGKENAVAQQELKVKAAQKEAEDRKREKLADLEARKQVKLQIEADKKERAEKAAREKALREGKSAPEASSSTAPAPPKTLTSTSNSATTRLQMRLPEGAPLTTSVDSTATLASVADWLVAQRPDLAAVKSSLKWSTTFPRKVFTAQEMQKSVKELGLTPSAALAVMP